MLNWAKCWPRAYVMKSRVPSSCANMILARFGLSSFAFSLAHNNNTITCKLMPKIHYTRFPVTSAYRWLVANLLTTSRCNGILETTRHNRRTTDLFPRQLVTALVRGNWCNGFWPLFGVSVVSVLIKANILKRTCRPNPVSFLFPYWQKKCKIEPINMGVIVQNKVARL